MGLVRQACAGGAPAELPEGPWVRGAGGGLLRGARSPLSRGGGPSNGETLAPGALPAPLADSHFLLGGDWGDPEFSEPWFPLLVPEARRWLPARLWTHKADAQLRLRRMWVRGWDGPSRTSVCDLCAPPPPPGPPPKGCSPPSPRPARGHSTGIFMSGPVLGAIGTSPGSGRTPLGARGWS